MRLALLSFLTAMTLASSASAEHPVTQAFQRYIECNKTAASTVSLEPYPAYMLSPTIPAMCKIEEDALVMLMSSGSIEELRAWLQHGNEQLIERTRREQRDGIMLIAPR